MDAYISGMNTRKEWIACMARTVEPVLSALSTGTLKDSMPVFPAKEERNRSGVQILEALGRSFAGIAPWLALADGDSQECRLRERLLSQLLASMGNIVDDRSPDRVDFSAESQILVDSAFLCHGFLRSWDTTWERLDSSVQSRIIDRLISTRAHQPYMNNWLLFSAMVEAFLLRVGAGGDTALIRFAFEKHLEWYKGDGHYGDGPEFHWDYYNSFVIQPMLLDLLPFTESFAKEIGLNPEAIINRARRFAEVQERLIAPDGSFPAIGRSITYRFGAFQLLGQMALRHELPNGTSPAQVRAAMTAVLRATLYAENTYHKQGWLNIGLAGHQPDLGESYISCGSLYLTLCGFLPLGLPATDPFWSDPDEPWSSQQIWSGQNIPRDSAYKEAEPLDFT
jgi:hypothetical protein